MRKYILLSLFLPALFILFSCRNKSEEKAVTQSYDTRENETIAFQAVDNFRYDFRFDIPQDWKAVDSSDNGDGFFIIPDENPSRADIRIYGSYFSLIDDEYGEENDEFLFADGGKGKIYSDYNTLIIEKSREDKFIILSVKTKDRQWMEAHHKILMKTGRSIRWIRSDK